MALHKFIANFLDNRNHIRMAIFGYIKEAELQRKEGNTVLSYMRLLKNEITEAVSDGEKWLSERKVKKAKRGSRRQGKGNRV